MVYGEDNRSFASIYELKIYLDTKSASENECFR